MLSPAPILDLIDIPLLTKTMNGTLMDVDPVPFSRQAPSPSVDAAWDRISTRNPIVIGRSDVLALGKDPDNAARWPASFGADKYVGKIDVFHQIHCLNMLRQSLRWNFDYYYAAEFPPGKSVDTFHTSHVDHCVSILLENLMCTANVDIYTHFWMDAQVHAFPDFNINHKCRDFDAVLAWQEANSIPLEEFAKARPRKGERVHIMSHDFKEIVRWYDDHPDDHMVGGEIA